MPSSETVNSRIEEIFTMTLRPHRIILALTSVLFLHVGACGSKADSGNAPASTPINCDSAQQVIPASCANRVCNGVPVPPDKDACTQCAATADQLGLSSNPLTACSCNKCAAQLGSCFQSGPRGEMGGSAERDAKCQAIVECALSTGCAGTDCYCGVGKALATCLNEKNMDATGPCAKQIEDAAGCGPQDRACVATAQFNAASPVALAYAVGVCVTGDPTMTPPAPGSANCKM
jgi:hypothetical protein